MNIAKIFAGVAALLLCAAPSFAASGEEIYAKRCAMCHDQANERIPPRAVLQKLPVSRIVRTLDAGVMMAVGFTLSREDRIAVASYLGTSATESAPPAAAFCSDRAVKLASEPTFSWNGWSPRSDNARFQPAEVARLNADQVRTLKLKWAFGFDGDVIAFAPPTVIDDELFVGSASGMVHAMRASSGCLQWGWAGAFVDSRGTVRQRSRPAFRRHDRLVLRGAGRNGQAALENSRRYA